MGSPSHLRVKKVKQTIAVPLEHISRVWNQAHRRTQQKAHPSLKSVRLVARCLQSQTVNEHMRVLAPKTKRQPIGPRQRKTDLRPAHSRNFGRKNHAYTDEKTTSSRGRQQAPHSGAWSRGQWGFSIEDQGVRLIDRASRVTAKCGPLSRPSKLPRHTRGESSGYLSFVGHRCQRLELARNPGCNLMHWQPLTHRSEPVNRLVNTLNNAYLFPGRCS